MLNGISPSSIFTSPQAQWWVVGEYGEGTPANGWAPQTPGTLAQGGLGGRGVQGSEHLGGGLGTYQGTRCPKYGWTPVGLQGRLSRERRQLTLCGPSYTATCLSHGLSDLGSTERRPGWPGWWVRSPEPCPGAWLRMQTHRVILSGRLSPRPVSLPETVAEAWGWPCGAVAGGQQGGSQRGRGPAGGQLAALLENGRHVMTDVPAWGICVMKNQCCPEEHCACLRGQEFARFGDTMTWHEARAESHSPDPSVASSSSAQTPVWLPHLVWQGGWAPTGCVQLLGGWVLSLHPEAVFLAALSGCRGHPVLQPPVEGVSWEGAVQCWGAQPGFCFPFPGIFFFLPDSSADSTDILKIFQFQPY